MTGRFWNLYTKLVATLLVLTAAGALVTASFFYGELVDQVRGAVLGNLARETASQARELGRELRTLTTNTRILSRAHAVQGIRRAVEAGGVDPEAGMSLAEWQDRLAQTLQSVLFSSPTYLRVRYLAFEEGGVQYAGADRGRDSAIRVSAERTTTAEVRTAAQAPHVRRAAAATDPEVGLSAFGLDRDGDAIAEPHQPVVHATVPVFGERGAVWGALEVTVAADQLFEALTPLAAPGRRFQVTDAAGRYLHHPDPERAFAFEFGAAEDARTSFPELASILEGTETMLTGERRIDEKERFFAVRRVDLAENAADGEPAVGLVLLADTAVAGTFARTTLREAAPLVLLGIVLVVFVGTSVASGTVRPLERLANDVRDLDPHDDSPVPVPDAPEAAALARAFNEARAGLVAARIEVEQANRDLERFAFITSHDLQEPARTMRSFGELLSQRYADALDDTGRQAVRFIVESSGRMQTMVRDLLEHSRLGRSGEQEDVPLDAVVDDVLVDLAEAIRTGRVEIERTGLPTVHGNRSELRLLFQNLIANAIKFRSAERTPRVRIAGATDAEQHQLVVEDNGIGVEPNLRERVFEVFQRAQKRGDYEGTGIGLAHCRRIVESLGGRIRLEDADGPGTRVVFELPATDADGRLH